MPAAFERYKSRLFPLADLITPNLDEAAAILGAKLDTLSQMHEAAVELYQQYQVPFLLKGGHLKSSQAVDVLIDFDGLHEFSEPYRHGVSTHGTGCTYSAAIAANLALGQPLREAVRVAKKYVTQRNSRFFPLEHQGGRNVGLAPFLAVVHCPKWEAYRWLQKVWMLVSCPRNTRYFA